MLVLTIVAIRLIGLWLIAANLVGIAAFGLAMFNLSQSAWLDTLEFVPFIAMAVAAILPHIAGLGLILLSKTLARLVVPAAAHELPMPASISARSVVQIGVFLIGLWLVGSGLPVVAAMAPFSGVETSPQHLISAGLGLVLMLGSGLLAGLVGKLRSWP